MNDLPTKQVPEATPSGPANRSDSQPVWVIGSADGSTEDFLSLRDIVQIIYRGKWIVLATIVLTILGSVLYLKRQQHLYTVEMIVTAVKHSDISVGTQQNSLLAGLANTFGVAQSTGQEPEYQLYKYYLTSPIVVERLQEKYGILQKFYESSWDPEKQEWIRPESTGWRGAVNRFFGLPDWQPPSARSFASFLEGRIEMEFQETSVELISMEYGDPVMASQILVWLHEEADALVRERDDTRLKSQLTYLESRVDDVQITVQRLMLNRMMLGHLQRRTLIDNELPYAADLIQSPAVPTSPTWPNPVRFLTLAIFGSILFGLLFSFAYEGLRPR